MHYMLDTDSCIYIIKNKPKKVIKKFKTFTVSEIVLSSITLSELLYGVSKSGKPNQNRIALTQFIAPMEVLPYDDLAAQEYGEIRADLEKKGTPIGSMDMLIGAHARSLDVTLVTNNEKEFRRIPNLKIENWI